MIQIYMPLIQISTYLGRTREQKVSFAEAMTNAVVEILKAKRQHVIVITYDQRKTLKMGTFQANSQVSDRQDSEIPKMCTQHKEN
jgi:4-oxalocrotonate tautomerase family enzyme